MVSQTGMTHYSVRANARHQVGSTEYYHTGYDEWTRWKKSRATEITAQLDEENGHLVLKEFRANVDFVRPDLVESRFGDWRRVGDRLERAVSLGMSDIADIEIRGNDVKIEISPGKDIVRVAIDTLTGDINVRYASGLGFRQWIGMAEPIQGQVQKW